MYKIVEVLGIPPASFLDQGTKTRKYFDKNPDGNYEIKRQRELRRVSLPHRLVDIDSVMYVASSHTRFLVLGNCMTSLVVR